MKKVMLLAGIALITSTSALAINSASQTSPTPANSKGNTTSNATVNRGVSNNAAPSKTASPTPNVASPSNASVNSMVNCQYHIPAETKTIDAHIITQWAENAAEQSFDFSHTNIDNELTALKNCFTEQGWQSFYDAFLKSGNLSSIKNDKLTVSSVKKGQSNMEVLKDNQWRVTVPLNVVYRNNQEKITQTLSVRLLITRKPSGDLGVVQIIAMPQKTVGNAH